MFEFDECGIFHVQERISTDHPAGDGDGVYDAGGLDWPF